MQGRAATDGGSCDRDDNDRDRGVHAQVPGTNIEIGR